MAGQVVARDTIKLILAVVMVIGLLFALGIGTAAIIWYGTPYGGAVRSVAIAAAWVFAAAFLATFGLVLAEEINKRSGPRAG